MEGAVISTLLAVSLVGSVAAWPLGRLLGRRAAGWVLALLPASLFAAFLRFAPTIEAGRTIVERRAWAPSLGVELTLRLDGFALLFCLLVTGIGALVVIYAGPYLSEQPDGARARFLALILLFMTAMLGAVLADDLVVFFLFWEATSVLSFLLIGFDADSPHAPGGPLHLGSGRANSGWSDVGIRARSRSAGPGRRGVPPASTRRTGTPRPRAAGGRSAHHHVARDPGTRRVRPWLQ
jgi:formate hydrogenlyase subunit 3/multisubunit Na+/H+ antiporter MnhD subunit